MTLLAFVGAVELGLVFSLLALGIFVNYRVLGVADLTVEGSFTTGAAVTAVFVVAGSPFAGLTVAVAGGIVAGLCAAFLQTKMRIQPILAGILVMTALYSVNLYIMGGRPNIPLLRVDTMFTIVGDLTGNIRIGPARLERVLLPLLFALVGGGLLGVFFHTRFGLSVRATGDNEEMIRASSINSAKTKSVGLAIGNGFAALSGGLFAQYQGFADINVGFGMVVVALASLIVGEAIFGRRTVLWNIGTVIAGAVIYRTILAFALSFRLNPVNLRAISALIVAAAISYPAIKSRWDLFMLKRKAGKIA
jgi:putative ABC transport system permease protein